MIGFSKPSLFFISKEPDKGIGQLLGEEDYGPSDLNRVLAPKMLFTNWIEMADKDFESQTSPLDLKPEVIAAINTELALQQERRNAFAKEVLTDPDIDPLYQMAKRLLDLNDKTREYDNYRLYTQPEAELIAKQHVANSAGLTVESLNERLSTPAGLEAGQGDQQYPQREPLNLRRQVHRRSQFLEMADSPFPKPEVPLRLRDLIQEARQLYVHHFEKALRELIELGVTPKYVRADKKLLPESLSFLDKLRTLKSTDLPFLKCVPTFRGSPLPGLVGAFQGLTAFLRNKEISIDSNVDGEQEYYELTCEPALLTKMLNALSVTDNLKHTPEHAQKVFAMQAKLDLLSAIESTCNWMERAMQEGLGVDARVDQYEHNPDVQESILKRLHNPQQIIPQWFAFEPAKDEQGNPNVSRKSLVEYMQWKIYLEGDQELKDRGDYTYSGRSSWLSPFGYSKGEVITPRKPIKKAQETLGSVLKEFFATFNLKAKLEELMPQMLGTPTGLPVPENMNILAIAAGLVAVGLKPDLVIKASHPWKFHRQLGAIHDLATFTESMTLRWNDHQLNPESTAKENIKIISRTPLAYLMGGNEHFFKVYAPQYANITDMEVRDSLNNAYEYPQDFSLKYDEHWGYYKVVLTKAGIIKARGAKSFAYTATIDPNEKGPNAPRKVHKLEVAQVQRAVYFADTLEKAGYTHIAKNMKKYLAQCERNERLPTTDMLARVMRSGARYAFKQNTGRDLDKFTDEFLAKQSGLLGLIIKHVPPADKAGLLAGQCATQNFVCALGLEFIFDSTHQEGEPFEFMEKQFHLSNILNAVSFTLGLRGMKAVGMSHADTRGRERHTPKKGPTTSSSESITHDITGGLINLQTFLEGVKGAFSKEEKEEEEVSPEEVPLPIPTPPEATEVEKSPENDHERLKREVFKLLRQLDEKIGVTKESTLYTQQQIDAMPTTHELLSTKAADIVAAALKVESRHGFSHLQYQKEMTPVGRLHAVLEYLYYGSVTGLEKQDPDALLRAITETGASIQDTKVLDRPIADFITLNLNYILHNEQQHYEHFQKLLHDIHERRQALISKTKDHRLPQDPELIRLEAIARSNREKYAHFETVVRTTTELQDLLNRYMN